MRSRRASVWSLVVMSRILILIASVTALSLSIGTTTFATASSSRVGGLEAAATSGTADCDSVTTCYTPQQLEVAYGVQPLLQRGIDGRGETVVLPEIGRVAAFTATSQ